MNTKDIGPSTSGCSGTTRTYYSNYTDLNVPIVIDDDDDKFDEDEVLTVKETNEASSKEPMHTSAPEIIANLALPSTTRKSADSMCPDLTYGMVLSEVFSVARTPMRMTCLLSLPMMLAPLKKA